MHQQLPYLDSDSNQPDAALLSDVQELLDSGRYLSAWELVKDGIALKEWKGRMPRTLAGRLCGQLGDDRLSDALHLVNYRQNPESDAAFFFAASRLISIRGCYRVEQMVNERLEASRDMDEQHRANLLAFQSWLLGGFRDFYRADKAITEALRLQPESSWVHTRKSLLLEMEDRYDEALEVAQKAVELSTGTPASISRLATAYLHTHDEDSAFSALIPAHENSECSAYASYLVSLFSERDETSEALHYLEEYQKRSPLIDKNGVKWATRRKADFLYLSGDIEGFLSQCDKLGSAKSYHSQIAANVRKNSEKPTQRVRLDVPFVRQHQMTCAPATLASIAAYWKLDFDHLEIAESICYEGTPWHKERQWAESNGFIAEEFRFTQDVLKQLIDKGVPFALTTEAVTTAHLQACVGYDDRQGIAILRDPTERHYGEIIASGLIRDNPVAGPRCMLVLPEAEAHRIEGIELPDSEVYQAYHDISVALDLHDRKTATDTLERMPEEHPLTLHARYRIGGYDVNPAAEFQAINELSQRFPENDALRYTRILILTRHHDPERQKKFLQTEVTKRFPDPVFLSEYGEFLLQDARQLEEADYYLRKAVRLAPRTGRTFASLAFCKWKNRESEEAVKLRRIASCLDASWEPYATSYAESLRTTGQPEAGIQYLRHRVQSLGDKSGGPWKSLAKELETQRRTVEAIEVLEEGIKKRPDDGELALAAGALLARWGDFEKGEALVKGSRGLVRETEWLEKSANLASFIGRRQEAIEYLKEFIKLSPFVVGSYRSMARLIAEEESREEAIEFLVDATKKNPEIIGLWTLRSEWETALSPLSAIASLEKALSLNPDSCWVLRELAVLKTEQRHEAGAMQAALDAISKDPNSPASHGTLASVHEEFGRKEEAKACCRQSIALDIDYTYGAESLLRLSQGEDEVKEALSFIFKEAERQVSDGSIVIPYRKLAFTHLRTEELLDQLRLFCRERPDLWQTWSARLDQALKMDLNEEAELCAKALTEQFPLLPRSWADLARVANARLAYEEEASALEKALELSPGWDWAARRISVAFERLERLEEALEVLERALHYEPLEGPNYGYLAELLEKMDRKAEAFERLAEGLRRCPNYHWGWSKLVEWSVGFEREDEVVSMLQEASVTRTHQPAWWSSYAEHLAELDRFEDALEVLEESLERHPKDTETIEYMAYILSQLDRIDEALETCQKGLEVDPENRYIRGRQAWILMHSGESNQAIEQMTSLVDNEPDYLWAIRTLTEWHSDKSNWPEVRKLSESWIRQEPDASIAHGYYAHASKALKKKEDAKSSLQKAFNIDPKYEYAGRNLLSLQIEDKELEAAEETLKTLRHFVGSASVEADATELSLAKGSLEDAFSDALSFFDHQGSNQSLVEVVSGYFESAGHKKDWIGFLDRSVADPKLLSPKLLIAWLHSLKSRNKLKLGVKLLDSLEDSQADLVKAGWLTLLEFPDSQEYGVQLNHWITNHRDLFFSDDELWAATGNALVEVQTYLSAYDWMKDWKSRSTGTEPDLLFNFGVAASRVKGWREGAEAREKALEVDPSGGLSNTLRAIVSLQKALNGDIETATELSEKVRSKDLSDFYGAYFCLARSILEVSQGNEAEGKNYYTSACRKFNEWNHDPGSNSVFESTVSQLAERLPWAKGDSRKLMRKWGRYRGADRTISPGRLTVIIVASVYLVLHLTSMIPSCSQAP